jgi:hypothetical protein
MRPNRGAVAVLTGRCRRFRSQCEYHPQFVRVAWDTSWDSKIFRESIPFQGWIQQPVVTHDNGKLTTLVQGRARPWVGILASNEPEGHQTSSRSNSIPLFQLCWRLLQRTTRGTCKRGVGLRRKLRKLKHAQRKQSAP